MTDELLNQLINQNQITNTTLEQVNQNIAVLSNQLHMMYIIMVILFFLQFAQFISWRWKRWK